jgi:hypothetical protein
VFLSRVLDLLIIKNPFSVWHDSFPHTLILSPPLFQLCFSLQRKKRPQIFQLLAFKCFIHADQPAPVSPLNPFGESSRKKTRKASSARGKPKWRLHDSDSSHLPTRIWRLSEWYGHFPFALIFSCNIFLPPQLPNSFPVSGGGRCPCPADLFLHRNSKR